MATACEESATARVQLSHLQQTDGIACETYEAAVNGLLEALKQDGVCIIEVDDAMSSILRKGLAAGILNFARLIFHGSNPGGRAETDGGHHALPGKEVYNVILGERPHVLPFDETFNNLSQLSASILAALAWTLGVHTTHFAALLDDTPLRPGDTSASMLSYFSYKERARKKGNAKPAHSACPAHIDKGLVTIVVSDDPKLEVLSDGRWKVVPARISDNEFVVLTGQALVEATGGLFQAAQHRVTQDDGQARSSLAFKCIPRQDAVFDRGPIAEANPAVPRHFCVSQRLLSVESFMADFNVRHTSVNKTGNKRKLSETERAPKEAASSTPTSNPSEENAAFTLRVKTQDGQGAHYRCRPSTPVIVLQNAVAARHSCDPLSFSLLHEGIRLDVGKTLGAYALVDCDVIDAMLVVRGD